jgi:dienelactone hydrolase
VDVETGRLRIRTTTSGEDPKEASLPGTASFQIAVVTMLWCVVAAPMADAWATPLQRVEFESASQRLVSGGLIRGDRIQGYLAKPDGAGPFPAVVGLHGCAGMHDTTKQRLADELVTWGYVVLLVDSFATRGIDQACTSGGAINFSNRRQDAYGGLAYLDRQSFVDPRRVAAVGFSQGAWVTLAVAEPNSFEQLVPPGSHLQFRAAAAFYPPCSAALARPAIPTLILIGTLDDWTPAADCLDKVAGWGKDGPPVELIVYPGTHHGFYYPHLQPGMTLFDHWVEYNGEAADDATHRLQQFLDRTLKADGGGGN